MCEVIGDHNLLVATIAQQVSRKVIIR